MKIKILATLSLAFLIVSCGEKQVKENVKAEPTEATPSTKVIDPMQDKGIGPITSVTLNDIDSALVNKGKEIFKAKCTACHKIGKRFVGPALKGVTKIQSPEWIMNMKRDF